MIDTTATITTFSQTDNPVLEPSELDSVDIELSELDSVVIESTELDSVVLQPTGLDSLADCLAAYPRKTSLRSRVDIEMDLDRIEQILASYEHLQEAEDSATQARISRIREKTMFLGRPQGLEESVMTVLNNTILELEQHFAERYPYGAQIDASLLELAKIKSELLVVLGVEILDLKYPNSALDLNFLNQSLYNPHPVTSKFREPFLLPQWAVFSVDDPNSFLMFRFYETALASKDVLSKPILMDRFWGVRQPNVSVTEEEIRTGFAPRDMLSKPALLDRYWRGVPQPYGTNEALRKSFHPALEYGVKFSGVLPATIWSRLPQWQSDFDRVVVVARADSWGVVYRDNDIFALDDSISVPVGERLIIGLKQFGKEPHLQEFAWQLALCHGVSVEDLLEA